MAPNGKVTLQRLPLLMPSDAFGDLRLDKMGQVYWQNPPSNLPEVTAGTSMPALKIPNACKQEMFHRFFKYSDNSQTVGVASGKR